MYEWSPDGCPHSNTPLSGLQILLVEDEEEMANLLLFVLEAAGAEVVWVSESSEALGYLSRSHPHILISTVTLPDYDGDWLIREVRQSEHEKVRSIPAIALTAHTWNVDGRKMLGAGFERSLNKQTDIAELVSTILEII